MGDAEIREWLRGAFLACGKALKLPRWAEEAAETGLNTVPPGLVLAWCRRLGLPGEQELRQVAGSVPDLAARLGSDQGQEAVRQWEAKRRVLPVLRAVRQAVKGICSPGRQGGVRREAFQGLAAMAVSGLVAGCGGLRVRIASAIGCGGDDAAVVRRYGELVATGDLARVRQVAEAVAENPALSEWTRDFISKGAELWRPPAVIRRWEFQPPAEAESLAGIRDWLFRRR